MELALRVALSLHLVLLTGLDLYARRNPWWATTPLLLGMLDYRAWQGPLWLTLAGWFCAALPYILCWYGAADFRLLALVWAWFPNLGLVLFLGIGMVVLSGVALFWERRRERAPAPAAPSRKHLLAQGRAGLFTISLPALAYMWLA